MHRCLTIFLQWWELHHVGNRNHVTNKRKDGDRKELVVSLSFESSIKIMFL